MRAMPWSFFLMFFFFVTLTHRQILFRFFCSAKRKIPSIFCGIFLERKTVHRVYRCLIFAFVLADRRFPNDNYITITNEKKWKIIHTSLSVFRPAFLQRSYSLPYPLGYKHRLHTMLRVVLKIYIKKVI